MKNGSKGANKQSCQLLNTLKTLSGIPLLHVYYAEVKHSTATQKEKWQLLH